MVRFMRINKANLNSYKTNTGSRVTRQTNKKGLLIWNYEKNTKSWIVLYYLNRQFLLSYKKIFFINAKGKKYNFSGHMFVQRNNCCISVNDTLDDILTESGDEEEEDSIVNQVLDEIGIDIKGKVNKFETF